MRTVSMVLVAACLVAGALGGGCAVSPGESQPAVANADVQAPDLKAERERERERERDEAFAWLLSAGHERIVQGRFEEALRLFQSAVRLKPANADALGRVESVRQVLGVPADWRPGAQPPSSIDMSGPEPLSVQLDQRIAAARASRESGDEEAARTLLNEALELCRWTRGRPGVAEYEATVRALLDEND